LSEVIINITIDQACTTVLRLPSLL